MARWTVTVADIYVVEVQADTDDAARAIACLASPLYGATVEPSATCQYDGQRVLSSVRTDEAPLHPPP